MRVLGLVGSMRKNRHTSRLVTCIMDEMQRLDPAVTAEVIQVADKMVHPCRVVCSEYCSNTPYRCSIADDAIEILDRMIAADALVIGAPLYFRAPPAGFQALAERLISIFFFYETRGGAEVSPLAGKPCGLVAVAEYSNPHQILEYLHDLCTVLKMRPVLLERFPYLGVAGQGELDQDQVFYPFARCQELAGALVEAVGSRDGRNLG